MINWFIVGVSALFLTILSFAIKLYTDYRKKRLMKKPYQIALEEIDRARTLLLENNGVEEY